MKTLTTLLLLAALAMSGAASAAQIDAGSGAAAPTTAIPALAACPAPTAPRVDTAQISQSDCCKGHKGVCGCRAGKIVCCDGSVSPNCTCHGDQGLAN